MRIAANLIKMLVVFTAYGLHYDILLPAVTPIGLLDPAPRKTTRVPGVPAGGPL